MSHIVEFPGLGLRFTVHEVAFSIGSYHIQWYGVILALGFLLGVLYASRMAKAMDIDMNRLFDAIIVGLIGSVICARLYYVAFYPGDKYIKNPIEILKIHDGGIAIYGSLIGALLFGGIMAKLRKLRVPAVLDVASLGFLIGQSIGRWGNFVNQEAFGEPTILPWGMSSDNTGNITVHPCFLYESLLCALGFVLLHIFNKKYRRYDGQTFLLYIVWYGACRFFIEGTRTDSLMLHVADLRVSQVVAAASVIAGVILLFVFRHRTSLSGCGSRRVREAIGLVSPEVDPELGKSTIFGDLPPEELLPGPEAREDSGPTEQEDPAAEEEDTVLEEAEEDSPEKE